MGFNLLNIFRRRSGGTVVPVLQGSPYREASKATPNSSDESDFTAASCRRLFDDNQKKIKDSEERRFRHIVELCDRVIKKEINDEVEKGIKNEILFSSSSIILYGGDILNEDKILRCALGDSVDREKMSSKRVVKELQKIYRDRGFKCELTSSSTDMDAKLWVQW